MIHLSSISTRAPEGLNKIETKAETGKIIDEIDELQNLLYAERKRSLLIIMQGMDASGKDGAVKEVFSKVNPMGVSITSFKAPTSEELSHDFLWRIHKHAPQKGMINIFNRSHYEDVLITRVQGWCDDETAKKRFKAINNFEALLTEHNDTTLLKFYLHISPEEQQERLKERMDNPKKNWKYNANDFVQAKLWDKYMQMYEDAFEKCNAIPWIIVPSDQNWVKEYTIAKTVRDTLKNFNMQYPKLETE